MHHNLNTQALIHTFRSPYCCKEAWPLSNRRGTKNKSFTQVFCKLTLTKNKVFVPEPIIHNNKLIKTISGPFVNVCVLYSVL